MPVGEKDFETLADHRTESAVSTQAGEQGATPLFDLLERLRDNKDEIALEFGVGGYFISIGNSFQRMMSPVEAEAVLWHLAQWFTDYNNGSTGEQDA